MYDKEKQDLKTWIEEAIRWLVGSDNYGKVNIEFQDLTDTMIINISPKTEISQHEREYLASLLIGRGGKVFASFDQLTKIGATRRKIRVYLNIRDPHKYT